MVKAGSVAVNTGRYIPAFYDDALPAGFFNPRL
jgi:hypothetical protein